MSAEALKISFAGDLMCLKEQNTAALARYGRLNFEDAFVELDEIFDSSDYIVGNLETPISGSAPITSQSIRFNSSYEFLQTVKTRGFGFLSTANNHCLDCGIRGLEETLCALDRMAIDHAGTYRTAEDAEQIFIKEIKGLSIALISFTYGTNSEYNGEMLPESEIWRVALSRRQNKFRPLGKIGFNPDVLKPEFTCISDSVSPAAVNNVVNNLYLDRILNQIKLAKEIADFVVVLPHIGGQYNPGPATYTKYVMGRIREAGADLVVAGHPHVVHRCEPWREGMSFACYSLGNFCFTPGVGFFVPNVLAEYGIVLHVSVGVQSKRIEKISFDVVRNVVDEDGFARTCPVVDLIVHEQNVTKRDRLIMENESVVHRFMGGLDAVCPQYGYTIGREVK